MSQAVIIVQDRFDLILKGLYLTGFEIPHENGSDLCAGRVALRVEVILTADFRTGDKAFAHCPGHGFLRILRDLGVVGEFTQIPFSGGVAFRELCVAVEDRRDLLASDRIFGRESRLGHTVDDFIFIRPSHRFLVVVLLEVRERSRALRRGRSLDTPQHCDEHAAVHSRIGLERGSCHSVHEVVFPYVLNSLIVPFAALDIRERHLTFGGRRRQNNHAEQHHNRQDKTKNALFHVFLLF